MSSSPSLTRGIFLLGFGTFCYLFKRRTVLLSDLGILTILCIGTWFANSEPKLDVVNVCLAITRGAAVPATFGMRCCI